MKVDKNICFRKEDSFLEKTIIYQDKDDFYETREAAGRNLSLSIEVTSVFV